MNGQDKEYINLSPRLAWLLAAPHTWPASIFPVLVALSLAYANGYPISVSLSMVLLVISILLQSAVNTINDYFDYVKGADTAEDNVDPSDAVLVYNNVNPASARNLAIGLIVVAFALGVYCIYRAGWIPLAIAAIGVVVIFLYSGGKTPISYLPIGEVCSGFVMGGLICLASYTVLTGKFDLLVLVWALPEMACIAMIMLTNNTCDIEKDVASRRRTLPVVLGRDRSVVLYRCLVAFVYVSIALVVLIWFGRGAVVLPFLLLATYPLASQLLRNPFTPSTRIQGMGQVCSFNIAIGAFYCACILGSTIQLLL